MRKFKIVDPDENGNPVETIMTEDEIIETFWDYWCSRMREVGKEAEISRENCIQDWVVIHWAEDTRE